MDLEINKVLSQMRSLQASIGRELQVEQTEATQSFGQAMNHAGQQATHEEITKVLDQMRALQASMGSPATVNRATATQGFGQVVADAVQDVNRQQAKAVNMAEQFQSGQSDASVAAVMVELQKASVSFQAMTEVRNRLIEAYREVMNMPV